MSDDWAVGDLALCVRGGGPEMVEGHLENLSNGNLSEGATYRVRRVRISAINSQVGFYLEGVAGGWFADRFRKIRPDAHEGNADDWALILETTKRKVRAA